MGLKRITLEYAEGLIKADDDLTDADVKYFTITPSTDPQMKANGYEDVTYYTNRPKKIQIPKGVIAVNGYMYLLTLLWPVYVRLVLLRISLLIE